jgi:hypothetical protein
LVDAVRFTWDSCETRQKRCLKNSPVAVAANIGGPVERPGVVGNACSPRPRTDETGPKLMAEQLPTGNPAAVKPRSNGSNTIRSLARSLVSVRPGSMARFSRMTLTPCSSPLASLGWRRAIEALKRELRRSAFFVRSGLRHSKDSARSSRWASYHPYRAAGAPVDFRKGGRICVSRQDIAR